MPPDSVPNMQVGLRFGLSVRWLSIDGGIGARVCMRASRVRMRIGMPAMRFCMGICTSSIMIIMLALCTLEACLKVVLVGLEPLYLGFLFS